MDCLVNVLARVGMKSLLLDVPFVCKSWHKASLNPSCWESLVFPGLDRFSLRPYMADSIFDRFKRVYQIDGISVTAFIKFIIKRSCRKATELHLPSGCTVEAFKYAVEECPALRFLRVPPELLCEKTMNFTDALGKWKDLEVLMLDTCFGLVDILTQLRILDYKNFSGIRLNGAKILTEHALAIVTLLPNIKHLDLRRARIKKKNLVAIIKGCRELVTLDVSYCVGFTVDEEMLKLTSHIPTFKFEGATWYDSDEAECEYLCALMELDGPVELESEFSDGYGSG